MLLKKETSFLSMAHSFKNICGTGEAKIKRPALELGCFLHTNEAPDLIGGIIRYILSL